MASIQDTIRTLLYGDSAVGAKVGSTQSTARIFGGGQVPQNTAYPFIQIETVSDQKTHLTSGGKYRFQTPTVQVSAWDTSYGKVRELADDIINAIDGNLNPAIVVSVETDLFDAQAQVHQLALDFKVLTAPL